MRAGHGQHPAPGQHVFRQPLRARGIRQATVEDRLHQRHATLDHVADHEDVRLHALELAGLEAFDQLDAQRLELGRHRRIDILVAARHRVAGRPRQCSDAAHESATNTENVDVHDLVPQENGRFASARQGD